MILQWYFTYFHMSGEADLTNFGEFCRPAVKRLKTGFLSAPAMFPVKPARKELYHILKIMIIYNSNFHTISLPARNLRQLFTQMKCLCLNRHRLNRREMFYHILHIFSSREGPFPKEWHRRRSIWPRELHRAVASGFACHNSHKYHMCCLRCD